MGEFQPVIRACARLGIDTPTMWEMELWEIAAALGVGEPEADETPASGPAAPTRDLTAERVAAARGERPPPSPDANGTVMASTVRPVPTTLRGASRGA